MEDRINKALFSCDKYEQDLNNLFEKMFNNDLPLTDEILLKEGFEKNEDVDDGEEYYYWTKELNNEIYLISSPNTENNGKYIIYIFDYDIPVCKTYNDLILLTKIFTKYTN